MNFVVYPKKHISMFHHVPIYIRPRVPQMAPQIGNPNCATRILENLAAWWLLLDLRLCMVKFGSWNFGCVLLFLKRKIKASKSVRILRCKLCRILTLRTSLRKLCRKLRRQFANKMFDSYMHFTNKYSGLLGTYTSMFIRINLARLETFCRNFGPNIDLTSDCPCLISPKPILPPYLPVTALTMCNTCSLRSAVVLFVGTGQKRWCHR